MKNTTMFYLDNQQESPALIMIHGNSLDSSLFHRQFSNEFLNQYHLIAPDLPGHGKAGRSNDPEKDYGVNAYIEFLKSFIHELGLQELVIFGHSLGGHLGIHLADSLTDVKVKGLILTGTPPLTIPPKPEEAFLANPAMAYAFKPDISDDETSLLAEAFMEKNHPDHALVKMAISQCDPLVRPHIGKSMATEVTSDEAEIIRKANFPVALLHGENDRLVNKEYIGQLNLPLWNDRITLIEKAGHTPFLENPEVFNRTILEFLREM